MSKSFLCPKCKEDDFRDLDVIYAECKKCEHNISKKDIKNGFTIALSEMSKSNFKERYCSECALEKRCKERGCYDEYYTSNSTFFWCPQGFDHEKITLTEFRQLLLEYPYLLMSYAAFQVVEENNKEAKLEDYVKTLYEELKEYAGYNVQFIYKFYVEGWYENKNKYNWVSPEPKPVLCFIEAG